jgi:hypothetical protein
MQDAQIPDPWSLGALAAAQMVAHKGAALGAHAPCRTRRAAPSTLATLLITWVRRDRHAAN